mgnify:CR=1 FL=1
MVMIVNHRTPSTHYTRRDTADVANAQHPPAARQWRSQAACKGMDTSLFVFSAGDSTPKRIALAAATCATCAVTKQCGNYAASNGAQTVGVWAGQMYTARKATP